MKPIVKTALARASPVRVLIGREAPRPPDRGHVRRDRSHGLGMSACQGKSAFIHIVRLFPEVPAGLNFALETLGGPSVLTVVGLYGDD